MSHRQLIVVRIDYRQTMNCAVALNTWGNENLITTKADVTVYSRFQELLQKMNDHKQAEDWASPNSYSSSQLTSSTSVISSLEQISLWVSFTSCEYISATFQTPKNWKNPMNSSIFWKSSSSHIVEFVFHIPTDERWARGLPTDDCIPSAEACANDEQ